MLAKDANPFASTGPGRGVLTVFACSFHVTAEVFLRVHFTAE